MTDRQPQHILSAEQFTEANLGQLFDRADEFRTLDTNIDYRREVKMLHFGRNMVSMFYEPSTRTRFSFEIAANKLGIDVVTTENAAEFSSAAKGETIEDTTKVLCEYGIDAIVLRTKEEGMANRAAAVSNAAIINGGDGKGEHPTQAALDMYTINNELGKLNGLNVVIGGDLANGRTAKSLALSLSKYKDNKITFVSTPELHISDDIRARLKQNGTQFEETTELHDALRSANVVYWTRLQLERIKKTSHLSLGQDKFVIDKTALDTMPEDAILLHPLPRQDEIPAYVDNDPRAKYYRQAGNGLYIRMAMLDKILKDLP